jgi:hypothetical protein
MGNTQPISGVMTFTTTDAIGFTPKIDIQIVLRGVRVFIEVEGINHYINVTGYTLVGYLHVPKHIHKPFV